jgi:hypothetical protein
MNRGRISYINQSARLTSYALLAPRLTPILHQTFHLRMSAHDCDVATVISVFWTD